MDDDVLTNDQAIVSNIAAYLPRQAAERPDEIAVIARNAKKRGRSDSWPSLTFGELDRLSNRYANSLAAAGIEREMRVLLMVRPGFDFFALVFALFKMRAVPVMIDPGMGVGRLLDCIRSVDLQAFVGIPLAQAMRVVRPRSFKAVQCAVTVGRRWFWGGASLHRLARGASESFEIASTARDDTAAILFTSGSTGPAKGVVYEHGMFIAQVEAIQSYYGMSPGEIDLPTFPLFGLFSIAMGMTVVVPDMDPSRPAHVNPRHIVDAIHEHEITSTFGSPALWKRVAAHCVQNGIKLPSLRRILIAGAPVPYPVIKQLHEVLDGNADVHTPYGATESLPVASISGREVIDSCSELTREGAGTCVGREMPNIQLRLIRINDDPIDVWTDDLLVPDGEKGEIVVSGPVVTKAYFGLAQAGALAKIRDGSRLWHRIGDIGYRDREGRIWFCGRKAHRVITADGTMLTVPCEAVFNEHPDVARCALVGVGPAGEQTPVIVVEPMPGKFPRSAQVLTFWEEMLELARANELTCRITHVLFHPSLPVDIRHNTKINREALAVWAATELR
ncbi:MAG: AMP-binding protein [Planctomycetes bacterium]|nr:AMP-binding protein [Planctomycetota bacterium]